MNYQYIKTDYLDMVSGGDKELVKELIDMFREQVREIRDEMLLLLSEKDYNALGLLAHKAKSSVAIMGMDDLAVMLKNFELQAKEGVSVENYPAYIDRFARETELAVFELEDLLKNM
ncbi:MAG: Hpt domain-containing protein [Bacteroidales bacterium]|nr:Hpt domain-containing protein [Bacteroidales bacterium]